MRTSLPKKHIFRELSKGRPPSSSTAHSDHSFNTDPELVHSTMELNIDGRQQPLPVEDTHWSETGSDATSIEIGRGGRRTRSDVSSTFQFRMGENDSLYEITGTPPLKATSGRRFTSGPVDKATGQQANISAPKRASMAQHGSLSEALRLPHVSKNEVQAGSGSQDRVTHRSRSTRFASRRASDDARPPPSHISHAAFKGHPPLDDNHGHTIRSATYSQSFAIPDISNIGELLSGADHSPIAGVSRTSKVRSRFNAVGTRPKPLHTDVAGVSEPLEEKAIYQSLHILRDRLAQLEMENAEAQRRAGEQDDEIIRLRSEVETERKYRRPDSGLGLEDELGSIDRWRVQRSKLETNVTSLQGRLNKSERKISNLEIALKRITKERDDLLIHFSLASEELKEENKTIRRQRDKLAEEIEKLREENETSTGNNLGLSEGVAEKTVQNTAETHQRRIYSECHEVRHAATARNPGLAGQCDPGPRGHEYSEPTRSKAKTNTPAPADRGLRLLEMYGSDIQAAIAQIQAQRQAGRETTQQSTNLHKTRFQSLNENVVPGSYEEERLDYSEGEETTTEMSLTQKARETLRRMNIVDLAQPSEENGGDITNLTRLSGIGDAVVDAVRERIEGDLKSIRQQRCHSSAKLAKPLQQDFTSQRQTQGAIPCPLANTLAAELHKATKHPDVAIAKTATTSSGPKTVRVQSPDTSDASIHPDHQSTEVCDASVLSNTSRRRRQLASSAAEGETSAFIIPDITLHYKKALPKPFQQRIDHDPATCTQCPHERTNILIPPPVPVCDKQLDPTHDITDATVRPANPPAQALATVIKQLGDEVVHLKLLLAEQQGLYNQHDPALSFRRRHKVSKRIDDLKAEIERRSDHIYNLNDVLLGPGNQMRDAANASGGVGGMAYNQGAHHSGSMGRKPSIETYEAGDTSDTEAELPL